jgi:hypothetical protein
VSKIGAGDGSGASVPGIEGSDIGDSELIAGTRTTYPGGDQMEYQYTLPNGVVVKSGPFPTDRKREAIMGWLDGLRGMIVSSAREAQEEAARVQREKLLATTKIEIPATVELGPAVERDVVHAVVRGRDVKDVSERPAVAQAAADRGTPQDPDDFAKRSLKGAKGELAFWSAEVNKALARQSAAQESVAKWTRVVSALED